MNATDYEKLGQFYLGCEYDLTTGSRKDDLLLYDSRDLLTHAVCVGMTGSGKTGLCIGLLEEAAIDGIPSVIVDPKGDLTNLLLTFPDLSAQSFRPWINEEEARRTNMTPDAYAAAQADLWRQGLANWGQDATRIARLRQTVDMAIYTPGSSAGLPVSILDSFAVPSPGVVADVDLYRERLTTTVTSLLSLLGIDADPIQSREHILLSTILDSFWKQGQSPDLGALIKAVQAPPVDRIGVFEIEAFYPSSDRFALAMQLNGLLAAPGFDVWLKGEPLDMSRMLHTSEGKPRVCIFSIAHLNDAQRMFFVSILLLELQSWMRAQSGTTSLRALFYMDEIFGYMPPVANPPSKTPLLTLLKQGRAFGLGCVLATQNPVDLDYKGLSNTGTWFIGRLQTERDRDRVLDGLEGLSAGPRFDRKTLEQILAGLGRRVFLLNNVHEDAPVIFETRWAMSYLRGPLTREQIKQLTPSKTPAADVSPQAAESAPTAVPATRSSSHVARPVLPPDIPQRFIGIGGGLPAGTPIQYLPMILGMGEVYYADAKAGLATEEKVAYLADISDATSDVNWDRALTAGLTADDLEPGPDTDDATYDDLPDASLTKRSYSAWEKSLRDWLYRNRRLELLKSTELKMVANPGEEERDFRIRLQLAAREKRDAEVAKLQKRYANRLSTLEDRLRRAQQKIEVEQEQARQQKLTTAMSVGSTLLSALLGRKAVSMSTLGRASTAMNRAGRISKEKQDVVRAQENAAELEAKFTEMKAELEDEIAQLDRRFDPMAEDLETVTISPRKSDIAVSLLTLAWVPHYQDTHGRLAPAWRAE